MTHYSTQLRTQLVDGAIAVEVGDHTAHREAREVRDKVTQGHPELAIVLVTMGNVVRGNLSPLLAPVGKKNILLH